MDDAQAAPDLRLRWEALAALARDFESWRGRRCPGIGEWSWRLLVGFRECNGAIAWPVKGVRLPRPARANDEKRRSASMDHANVRLVDADCRPSRADLIETGGSRGAFESLDGTLQYIAQRRRLALEGDVHDPL